MSLFAIAAAAKRLNENVGLVDIVLSHTDNVDYANLAHIDDGS